ncbi:hypothetical protein J6S88_02935 [bacterium]|nr:hypothetical protein [bacterium]
MNVLPVNIFSYKNQNPHFSSYNADVYKKGKILYRNHTELLRLDICWQAFIDLIIKKYQNVPKVNIVNHACSAGYEAWTLLILLLKKLGVNYKKFMPIIARDIDKKVIEYAQKGKMELCSGEYYDATYNCPNIIKENFDVVKRTIGGNISRSNEYLLTCKTDLKKNIDFKCSDIFKDKDLISKDNTILLCRNFWPYLGAKKSSELAYFLANNMKSNSLLVVGDYDYDYGIRQLLLDYGFKPTNVEYVFEAPGKSALKKVKDFEFEHKLREDLFSTSN